MLPVMPIRQPISSSQKMKDYRDKLRAQGLRPIQIWVPDTHVPGFQKEFNRQVARLNQQGEDEIMDFIEQVAETE